MIHGQGEVVVLERFSGNQELRYLLLVVPSHEKKAPIHE